MDAVNVIARDVEGYVATTFTGSVTLSQTAGPSGVLSLTCPAEINVQGYVQLVKMGKYEEAVKLIMERLPLPGVLGRVCPHPCEAKCRRAEMDTPVAICSLKRFAADQVDLAELHQPPAELRPEKVAIIGSGPAGLTCAYHLVLRGYKPTIFEALPMGGGMLRVGIPEYRLPRIVLVISFAVYGTANLPWRAVINEQSPLESQPELRVP